MSTFFNGRYTTPGVVFRAVGLLIEAMTMCHIGIRQA